MSNKRTYGILDAKAQSTDDVSHKAQLLIHECFAHLMRKLACLFLCSPRFWQMYRALFILITIAGITLFVKYTGLSAAMAAQGPAVAGKEVTTNNLNPNKANLSSSSSESAKAGDINSNKATGNNTENAPKINGSDSSKDYMNITIGAYTTEDMYYPVGASICLYLNHERVMEKIHCNVVRFADAVENVNGLREAKVDFIILSSNMQKDLMQGSGNFAGGGPYTKLRTLFSLYDEAFTIITRKGANIMTINNLRGKAINIAKTNKNEGVIFKNIMQVKGWTYDTFKSVTNFGASDAQNALCNGSIDAMLILTAHPSEFINQTTQMCETAIIAVDDPEILDVLGKSEGYTTTTIPEGMYLGSISDIKTIGVNASLMTTSDLDTETVYNITKVILRDLSDFKHMYKPLYALDFDAMLSGVRFAPMHDGVYKYLQELKIVNTPVGVAKTQQKTEKIER